MSNQTNFSLEERVKGHGPAIGQDELLDLLTELDEWREAASRCENIECPQDMQPVFDELCANQENPDHADYDDLKEFFDDCQNLIGYSNPWQCTADNAKAMLEELHEMNRQLGGEA